MGLVCLWLCLCFALALAFGSFVCLRFSLTLVASSVRLRFYLCNGAVRCDEPKVILGSWPTPSDEWTEEHVLQNTESRPVNLVFNRTSSLQKLANRRADVVVFADAPLDSKSYFLSFGRVAPVQARLRLVFRSFM